MWYQRAEVLAALIAAFMAACSLGLQIYFAKLADKRARESEERVAKLQGENSAGFLRLQHILGDQAAYRDARREALSGIWCAASNARFAADGIVQESNSAQLPSQIARTADFVQEISAFLNKIKQVESNAYLETQDIDFAIDVQNALIRLFLALDPDAEDKPSYLQKLDNCRTHLDKTMRRFVHTSEPI